MTWRLRPAEADDSPAIAAVHRRSREDSMPWLPDLHTPLEDVAYFEAQVATTSGWVVVEDGSVFGYALASDGWLNHLYVDVGAQGRGVGSSLLDAAIAEVGTGMRLWAFQRNERALAFYAKRGFVEIERTDGLGNEEREPDVLLRWG